VNLTNWKADRKLRQKDKSKTTGTVNKTYHLPYRAYKLTNYHVQ